MFIPIGLFSNATAGKDTLYDILESIFNKFEITTEKFSLASELKLELSDFTRKQYGISSFTTDPYQKTLIRPIMVEHGRVRRTMTSGSYWIDILHPKIKESLQNGNLPIICDIRYDVYQKDELSWLKNELNGLLIHIERVLPNGSLVQPANIDEIENGIKLEKQRDFHLKWPTTDNKELRLDIVKIQLSGLINKIKNLSKHNVQDIQNQ